MSAEAESTAAPVTEPAPVIKSTPEPEADSKTTPPVASPAPVGEESKPTSEALSDPKPAESSTLEKHSPASKSTPTLNLFEKLPSIIEEADYGEMWGIELKDASHVPTAIVLEKFLRANSKDVTKAKTQLTDALRWRKKMQPMKLLADSEFDFSKFGDLGYVTVYPKLDGHAKEVVTWNIYGAVKDNKATFGNVEE